MFFREKGIDEKGRRSRRCIEISRGEGRCGTRREEARTFFVMATCLTRACARVGASSSRPSTSKKAGGGRKSLEEIARGEAITGRVSRVLADGLVVNVKAEVDALLHRKELGKDTDRFEEFKKGQQLVARVKQVDRKKRNLQLTLRNGGHVEWRRTKARHLQPNKIYAGVVKKLKATPDEQGWLKVTEAFVDIGAQYDAHLATAQGVPGVGSPVQVRILPDGTDPETMRVRRRVSAELVVDEEREKTTLETQPKALNEPYHEEEEEEDLGKYDYLDDIY